MPRVALVTTGAAECKANSREAAFVQALRSLGCVPGKTLAYERKCYRNAAEMRAHLAAAEQASTFDLVVNAKTAGALGIPPSPSLLTRASRVMQ